MSLIKLALANTPIIVVNKPADPNSGSSKTFSPKNVAAAAIGGTTGFALSDAIEQGRFGKFDKTKMLHRYGRRMGSIVGGFAGAAGIYALLNKKKKEQEPNFYML